MGTDNGAGGESGFYSVLLYYSLAYPVLVFFLPFFSFFFGEFFQNSRTILVSIFLGEIFFVLDIFAPPGICICIFILFLVTIYRTCLFYLLCVG